MGLEHVSLVDSGRSSYSSSSLSSSKSYKPLDYVSSDYGSGYSSPTIFGSTSYKPLTYVGSDSGGLPRGKYASSVIKNGSVTVEVPKDDSYHFGDGTKAVLKGAGKVVSGTMGFVGNVMESTGQILGGAAIGFGLGAGMSWPLWGWGWGGPMWFPHHHHRHHHHCW